MISRWFADSSAWWSAFVILEWGLRIAALVWIPFRRSPEKANAWLALIFFEPIIGYALYLVFGRTRMPVLRLQRLSEFEQFRAPVRARLLADPNVFRPTQAPEIEPAVHLTERLGDFPILGGNSVELLTDYDGIFQRLIADIDAAREHVNLMFYIVGDDATTRRVFDALVRAHARGVQVRLLADALGSRATGFEEARARLEREGIEALATMRLSWIRSRGARFDLRNHRKVAIIDSRVAYTGSQNLIDARFIPGLTYEELMVRVTGPVVLELQAVFAQDWYQETGRRLGADEFFPSPEITGTVPAQVLPSSPLFPRQNMQRLIVALLGMARESAIITTPYFIPDDVLRQALTTAVLRGVDVRLVVPAKDDQLLVSSAQKSYYLDLLRGGVRICRSGAGFLHAKHVSIDGRLAWIGSSNMDIRSFALNAEVVLLVYDRGVCAHLAKIQERYFSEGTWLDAHTWGAQPLWRQVGWNVARLFSQLL